MRVSHMEWFGHRVTTLISKAGQRGVESAAHKMLDDANMHVPFNTGQLRETGAVTGDSWDATDNEAAVSYDTEYAVIMHEHPEYNFQGSGEGKWLEHAMQRRANSLEKDIAPPLIETLLLP